MNTYFFNNFLNKAFSLITQSNDNIAKISAKNHTYKKSWQLVLLFWNRIWLPKRQLDISEET